jgi:hypothetical protein
VVSSVPTVPTGPPRILLNTSGTSNDQTATFSTSGSWTVNYSYTCKGLTGAAARFQVIAYADDGSGQTDTAVDVEKAAGVGAKVEHLNGSFYVDVVSQCSWHVVVTGVGTPAVAVLPEGTATPTG